MAAGENLGAKFTLDISNLKAGLAEANKMIRQSESEFIEAAAGMNDWSKSADGLTLRVKSLNDQVDIQKQKISALLKVKEETIEKMKKEGASNDEIAASVDKVNSQLAKEQKQLETLQGKADKAGKELEDFNASENDATKGANELEKGVKDAGDAAEKSAKGGFTVFKGVLANLVTGALTAAVGALKNFAGSVLETGMSFDSAMSNVAALSGATGEELELLTNTAREFGATTQFSASEAADALGYMALAGWDAKQSTEALGGVLDLAAASGMGLAQASDMVTDYLSAFGMEASQSAEFADMLAYAQANSNTSAEQLGEAYKNSAANLNAAGQDVQTVTALLSSMANQGLKGAAAGTALSAIMRDITKKMENGKIAIGDTNIEVMDAQGNYRDLTEILADVEKATEGMGDAERSAALLGTFTSDSLKGLNLVLNEGVESAANFEEGLRNSSGSASEMAKTLNDNLQGDLKALSSAFDEFKLTIFESANAPLRDLVQTVTGGVLPALTDMIKGAEGADVAFGKAVGDLASKAISNLVNLLPQALKIAKTLIPTVIDGILSQLPSLVSFVFSDLVPSALSLIQEVAPKIINSVVSLIPQLCTELINAAPLILQSALSLLMSIVEAIPVIAQKLIGEDLPNLISQICDFIISALPLLLDAGTKLFMSIIEALPVIVEALETALPQIIDKILTLILDGLPIILQGAIELFMSLIRAIPTILGLLTAELPKIISTIISTLLLKTPELLAAAIKLFWEIIKAIPQICIELARQMPLIISSIIEGLTAGFKAVENVGSALIRGLWSGISNMGKWIGQKIKGFGQGVLNNLKSFFGIKSPSRVMRDVIGRNLALGIGEGFDVEMANVAHGMQNALNDAIPTVNANVGVGGSSDGTPATRTGGGVIINQTNNYSQQHSRFEIYQSKQATAAAVRAALSEV